jgi:uncharacterized protein with GYD domain
MATYILLGSFTDQGLRAVKNTTKRAEEVRALGKKIGVTVKDIYWTLGQHDVVVIVDAPDETAAAALSLSVGVFGNVRYQTIRALTAAEADKVLGRMA